MQTCVNAISKIFVMAENMLTTFFSTIRKINFVEKGKLGFTGNESPHKYPILWSNTYC